MDHTIGQFVAIFKFYSGQFWPISSDTLANFSFSDMVTLFTSLFRGTAALRYTPV